MLQFFILLFLGSSYLYGSVTVQSIKNFSESDGALDKLQVPKNRIWLVFDIDNTLITPDGSGKDSKLANEATDGFYYRRKTELFTEFARSLPETAAKERAYRQAVDEWNGAVRKDFPLTLVDKDFPKWHGVKLQAGFRSMAHTARELELAGVTANRLGRFEIHFPRASSVPMSFEFPSTPSHPEPALFKNGIFYVGRGGIAPKNHKGKRFLTLLQEIKNQHPKDTAALPLAVAFYDDRLEHVTGMVEELAKVGIHCLGFHVTAIKAEPEPRRLINRY